MPKYKIQDPDLWVRKRIERLDNQELPPVGVFSSPPDCEYQNNFISAENLDVEKLIKDLSSSFHFKRNKFDVDAYKNSISSRFKNYKEEYAKKRETVKSTIRPTQQKVIFEPNQVTSDQLDRGIEALNYLSLAADLSVNTTKCYLNNKEANNHFKIDIDITNKSISYTYYIYFEDTAENNDGKAAIILKTGGADLLLFFLDKVYGKNKARKVRSAIWKAFMYKLYDQNSIESLAFLYDKLPGFMRLGYHTEAEKKKKPYKISDELLWKHFKMFAAYDRGSNDASYYVIYIMTLITPLFCMQRFMEDQKLVLYVYENLDDQGVVDDFFGWYDLSKTFRGSTSFEPTNRDVFATLIYSYTQMFEGNEEVCVFDDTGAHFHQGKHDLKPQAVEAFRHTVSYGITADVSDDTIYLKNKWRSIENRGYTIVPGNRFKKSRTVIDEVISDWYFDGYYNPLEIIKFTQYNERGEAITMNAPAIFVRHVAYIKKWERIGKVMRLGFNLLVIIGSAATIYSGASSMMLYAAITDMGLATGDIFIQEKLARGDYGTKEGREFLALWDKIYNTAGFLTFTPVAAKLVVTNTPKIIGLGADLLQVTGKRIYKKEAIEKVQEFTLRAIRNLEIPNFNKTGLQIVKLGQKIAGLTNISKLQRVGVIFVRGGKNTVAAVYRGVVIAKGKVKTVALQLRTALRKLRGKELEEYLEELRYLGGMAENIKTTKNVDAFLAAEAKLLALKITPKNALKYLDEALPHFNYKVVEHVVDGVLQKVVIKIGDENCASVVKVVDEVLKTGVINKAEPIGFQGFDFFGKDISDFRLLSPTSMKNVMKEGERGIIFGKKGERIGYRDGEPVKEVIGHYFNVIKKDGELLYKDGQTGRDAILGFRVYENFRYLKTN